MKHLSKRRKNIRARLALKDMTAAALATNLGISEAHMSNIINGKFNPGDDLAKKISRALGSTRAYLNL